MENLNNVVDTTNDSVNAANEVSNGLQVATQQDKPKVVNLPKVVRKLDPVFDVDAELLKGLPLELKQNIYKTVEFSSKKPIPNFGGNFQVLVVFENSYTVSKTETQTTNEFVKNVKKEFLPIVVKGKDNKPVMDELGNVTLIEDNVIKTGNTDSLGRETYFVKSTNIVKGWRQVRTYLETTEQPTVVPYPYIFTIPESRANDLSFINGAAATLHQRNLKRMEIEKNTSYKYNGLVHVTFNIGGEYVSTKLVSDKGVKSQLIKSDFSAFARSLFLRLKDAIALRTETIETVDAELIFE